MGSSDRPLPLARPARRRALRVAGGGLLACVLGASATSVRVQAGENRAPVGSPPDLDVPFVTTPDNVVDTMLAMAGLRAGEYLIDLGSGDGRIVIAAALRGARGLGVEIDPGLVAASRVHAREAGVAERTRFLERDLFATDLTRADVITMYLLPDVNLLLRPRLLALRPGVRLVSHDWDMGDWLPTRTETVPAPQKKLGLRKEAKLMLWVVPANLAGEHLGIGAPLRLLIDQTYDRIDGGRLTWHDDEYELAPTRVDGAAVTLTGRALDARTVTLSARVGEARWSGMRVTWTVRTPRGPAGIERVDVVTTATT